MTLALAVLLAFGGRVAAAMSVSTSANPTGAIRSLGGLVARYQQETWRWQRLMGQPATPTAGRTLASMSVADVKRATAIWRVRAENAQQRAQHPPHLRQWLCIYRYEHRPGQGWRTNTGNGYYGGLQMDLSFQRRYGARLLREKGSADRWTPLEQIWVAERAHRAGRGFWPWPNTARYCGLI